MRTYDLSEAAAFLKISKSSLRAKAKRGGIPGRKIGKRLVFVEQHLANWISGYTSPMGVETTEEICPSTSVIDKRRLQILDEARLVPQPASVDCK